MPESTQTGDSDCTPNEGNLVLYPRPACSECGSTTVIGTLFEDGVGVTAWCDPCGIVPVVFSLEPATRPADGSPS